MNRGKADAAVAESAPQSPQVRTRRRIKEVRRPDLQGMRAVAVLTVFANHLFGWPPGGFVGVDVFFVLSGFFITSLLIRERSAKGSVSFRRFYIRRIKRIVPSALLVLTVTVLAGYLVFPPIRARDTLIDALYAAVFASNFRFEAVGNDYFQQNLPPSPLQHYWSLSIEEQFYFVWPALLVLIFAVTRRGVGGLGKSSSRRWGLTGVMSIIVLASFGWALYLAATQPNAAYFSTGARIWELGVGALVATAGRQLKKIPSTIRPGLAYLGLAGVLASLFLITPAVQFPAPWAALPVLSTALVIAAFRGADVRGMSLLTNPVARYLGDTSYTLYLWHFPVIVLLQALLPKGPLYYGLALTLTLGLTAVTYRFYENPIRTSKWLLPTPETEARRAVISPARWVFIGATGAMAAVFSILFMGYSDTLAASRNEVAATKPDQPQVTAVPSGPKIDPCFGATAMVTAGCSLRHADIALRPPIDDFTADIAPQSADCYVKEDQQPISCTFGYPGPDAKRIALVGESHATSVLPGLLPFLNDNKWSLTTYTGFECKFVEPVPPKCAFGAKTREDLLAHPYDLVLVAQLNNGRISPAGLASAVAPIAAKGSRVVLLQDNPMTDENALACVTRARFNPDRISECGVPESVGFRFPDPIPTALQDVPGTQSIELKPFFCKDGFCPSVIGDVIVYRDAHHITGTFALTLAKPLEEGLQRAFDAPGPPGR